jgi:hypothetical protein
VLQPGNVFFGQAWLKGPRDVEIREIVVYFFVILDNLCPENWRVVFHLPQKVGTQVVDHAFS